MNKSVKRLVSVLLAMLVLTVLSVSALADTAELTVNGYKVTVSTGNVDGAVFSDRPSEIPGGEPNKSMVNLGYVELSDSNSPYFFKGFRPAGKDNNVIYSYVVDVTEDCDYVAAYGLKADLVSYTVRYLDEDGNELEDSETHYGNVGDKLVVRFKYIDGYEPQAYNLGKTLLDDAGKNSIDFIYSRVVIPTPVPEPSPTPYVYTEGGGTVDAGTTEIGGGAAPAGGGEAAPAPGGGEEAAPAEEQPAEQQTETIEDDQTPLNNGPAEFIDLDDTPTGDTPELKEKPEVKEKPKTDLQQERADNETKLYISAGLLALAVATIAVLVVLLVKKRKA